MKSKIKVCTCTNTISMGRPMANVVEIIKTVTSLDQQGIDIALFPAFALCGSQCGTLVKNQLFIENHDKAINQIFDSIKSLDICVVIGGYKKNEAYIISNKNITLIDNDNYIKSFKFKNANITVYSGELGAIYQSLDINKTTDVLLIPCYEPAIAGNKVKLFNILKDFSQTTDAKIFISNGSIGDTSFPYINKPFCMVVHNQEIIKYKENFFNKIILTYDVELDIISSGANKQTLQKSGKNTTKTGNTFLSQHPYLPQDEPERSEYLDELFSLQAHSLAIRMKNINVSKLVIGVSGGLDSTLALLVCAKAMDILNLDRSNVTAITMQGFGTSSKTYDNAVALMNKLGCEVREIPIRESVLQHFEDIGHDRDTHDVTYENAQARERTQILMDIANKIGAIVVGTGDLSEASLGFCTFGGDHLASYNVNVCLNKTTIRFLTTHLAKSEFSECKDILLDIVDTPVSPELLPTDDNGKIAQKTEQILGEYELHDFFLYCFIKFNYSPKQILESATDSFVGKYDREYIKEKLKIFLKRFATSQFKRSCAVDSAVITEVNLSSQSFFIPSDLNPVVLLDNID